MHHAAPTAGRNKRSYDVIASLEMKDTRTDFLNDASAFVSTDERELLNSDIAVGKVVVGVTKPRGNQLD